MKVQAFIPTWPGEKQHPATLHSIISPFCETTVLDNPEHYFTEQWSEMRKRFSGDVMLWVMADACLYDFPNIYKEMLRMLSRDDIGIYAPNVCWTGHVYEISKLIHVDSSVYEVAMTDLLCYSVKKEILEKMPPVSARAHGWGIEILLTAIATKMGKKTVRDYKSTVGHPNSTNYHIPEAAAGMEEIIVNSGMEKEMREVMELRDKQHV
jgi:hypothetical protein